MAIVSSSCVGQCFDQEELSRATEIVNAEIERQEGNISKVAKILRVPFDEKMEEGTKEFAVFHVSLPRLYLVAKSARTGICSTCTMNEAREKMRHLH